MYTYTHICVFLCLFSWEQQKSPTPRTYSCSTSIPSLVNSPQMISTHLDSIQFPSISLKPSFAGRSSRLDYLTD